MSYNDRLHEAAHACYKAYDEGVPVSFRGEDLLHLADALSGCSGNPGRWPWELAAWARNMAHTPMSNEEKYGHWDACPACQEDPPGVFENTLGLDPLPPPPVSQQFNVNYRY